MYYEDTPTPLQTPKAFVTVVKTPDTDLIGEEFWIEWGEVRIGRLSGEATIAIPDPATSRRHATIYLEDNRYYIEDCGSTHGTWVNGREITERHLLQHGYRIQTGDTIMEFSYGVFRQ